MKRCRSSLRTGSTLQLQLWAERLKSALLHTKPSKTSEVFAQGPRLGLNKEILNRVGSCCLSYRTPLAATLLAATRCGRRCVRGHTSVNIAQRPAGSHGAAPPGIVDHEVGLLAHRVGTPVCAGRFSRAAQPSCRDSSRDPLGEAEEQFVYNTFFSHERVLM